MSNSPVVPTNRATRRSLARRGGALGAGGVLVAGSAAALLTALAGSAGAAATVTVDSNADGTADATHCTDGVSNNCTLRDAVAAAADGDTITFFPSVTNITLTDGSIVLGAENIAGPGSSALTITTTAAAGSYNLFNFQGAGDVTVSGLSLTKNGIFTANYGNFTMNDVSISNSYSGYGGALYAVNAGDLVISGCHFEDNKSGNASEGGAIYAINGGDVTITDTEIINNDAQTNGAGGGIFVGSAATSFSLSDSVVTGNSAGSGGGLDIRTAGTVTIADSDISSNTTVFGGAGAIIQGAGADVSIEGSTIDGNFITGSGDGGGLKVADRSLVVTDSTISNNVAGNAGGGISIDRGTKVTINNTTITGNGAVTGGGLYASHMPVEINQSTIANNGVSGKGGGVWLYFSSMDISGTIISGNTAAISGDDVSTLYVTAINSDHSLLGNVGVVPGFAPVPVTDLGGTIRSSTPGLSPLADNGGLTKTMALDPSSIAIDAGPDPVATFTGNGFDQRGTPYVRVSGSSVDIGAFELPAYSPPTSSTTSTSTTSTTSTTTLPPTSTTTLAIDPTTTVGDDPMAPAFTG
jgi:hypothetical protein